MGKLDATLSPHGMGVPHPRDHSRERMQRMLMAVLLSVAAYMALAKAWDCGNPKNHSSPRCGRTPVVVDSYQGNYSQSASKPIKLLFRGIYLDPPSDAVAVHFDPTLVLPATIQLHYKLKFRRNHAPEGWKKARKGIHAPSEIALDNNSNNATGNHEYKKCLPISITKGTAFFDSKCVNFRGDYDYADENYWLIYKFKLLAKKANPEIRSEYEISELPAIGKDKDVRVEESAQHESPVHGSYHHGKTGTKNHHHHAKFWKNHEKSQKHKKKKYVFIEEKVRVLKRKTVPWPFANEDGVWPPNSPNAVGNVMQNYQTFNPIPYIHGGVDIRTAANASCHTPVDGRVVKVVKYGASDLYYSIMIQDEFDFIWQFHHLDPSSFRVKEGDFVRRGRVIGYVAFWPDAMNEANYHHTHMNVARVSKLWKPKKEGYPKPYVKGWTYYNPFAFMNHGKYTNRNPPTGEGILFLFKNLSEPAIAAVQDGVGIQKQGESSLISVNGTVHAVTQLASEFSPSNSLEGYPYSQCPYEVVWFISRRDATTSPAVTEELVGGTEVLTKVMSKYSMVGGPTVVVRFDRLPPAQWPRKSDSHDPKVLLDLYTESFQTPEGETVSSVFNYKDRKVYLTLTNNVAGEIRSGEGTGWDTTLFKNGEYVFHVMARDWWGLWVHKRFAVNVSN
ncbi:hypothetical protein HDU81_006635 [Chytriomyces hyalinus]|nr:hypothetical protein HDU81_006635 [Chytriomyces hyalinus]